MSGAVAVNLAGTSDDRTLTFSHNPAGQITSRTDSNTGYAWTDFVNFDEATSYNGLNQMLSVTGQRVARAACVAADGCAG